MRVHVTLTNEDRGWRFADWDEESGGLTRGELFRIMQREYGRCRSAVYVDLPSGKAAPIGWYFQSRQRYEDARTRDDTYLRGAWVTIEDDRAHAIAGLA